MGNINENWILEKAAETTKDALVALLSSPRNLPAVISNDGLVSDEQSKRYGQNLGLMYEQLFIKVVSTLRNGKS